MKRRRRILIVFGLLALLAVITFFLTGDGGPKHKGRSLTEWALLHERATGWESVHNSKYDPDMLRESEAAILAIGTNALPWLAKWIQVEIRPTPWRDKIGHAIDRLPGELWDKPPLNSWLANPDWDRAKAVEVAFDILGTNASPVVPELTDLLFSQRSPDLCGFVSSALASIGEAGIPPLLAAVENPAFLYRSNVIVHLHQRDRLGTNSLHVVELLAKALGEEDEQVASKAAFCLGRLALHLEVSVPALAKGLTDPRPKVRSQSAMSLCDIGEPAHSALPVLLSALNDRDRDVRDWVTSAVRKIKPELLSPATNTVRTANP